jgi:hypothetical protein
MNRLRHNTLILVCVERNPVEKGALFAFCYTPVLSVSRAAAWVDLLPGSVPSGSHMPGTIPGLCETIGSGNGGIAKNAGMVSWIDSVQAPRHHIPSSLFRLVACQSRRSSAEHEDRGKGNFDLGQHCHIS